MSSVSNQTLTSTNSMSGQPTKSSAPTAEKVSSLPTLEAQPVKEAVAPPKFQIPVLTLPTGGKFPDDSQRLKPKSGSDKGPASAPPSFLPPPIQTNTRNHRKRPHPSTDHSDSKTESSSYHEDAEEEEGEGEEGENSVESEGSEMESDDETVQKTTVRYCKRLTRQCYQRAQLFTLLSDPRITLAAIDPVQLQLLIFGGGSYTDIDYQIILRGLLSKMEPQMHAELEMPLSSGLAALTLAAGMGPHLDVKGMPLPPDSRRSAHGSSRSHSSARWKSSKSGQTRKPKTITSKGGSGKHSSDHEYG